MKRFEKFIFYSTTLYTTHGMLNTHIPNIPTLTHFSKISPQKITLLSHIRPQSLFFERISAFVLLRKSYLNRRSGSHLVNKRTPTFWLFYKKTGLHQRYTIKEFSKKRLNKEIPCKAKRRSGQKGNYKSDYIFLKKQRSIAVIFFKIEFLETIS